MGDQAGLGSCFVGSVPDGGRFSLCVAGGVSDGGCDPNGAERAIPSSLCLPGYLCFASPGNSQGTCSQLCDGVSIFCPAGQQCVGALKAPMYGRCE